MKNKKHTPTNSTSTPFSKLTVGLIGALTLLIGIIFGTTIGFSNKQEIAHIHASEVFTEFKLTKEFQTNFNNTRQARETILNNLELRINGARNANNMSLDSLEVLVNERSVKQKYFEQDNQEQLSSYNEQVWTQLNQYIQDYSDENGYDYILGASGNGTLMGANPGKDITKEVIAFVNQKYSGK